MSRMNCFCLAITRLRAIAILAVLAGASLGRPAFADMPTIERAFAANDAAGTPSKDTVVELDGWLAVVLVGDSPAVDLTKATLLLDGAPISGLPVTLQNSVKPTLIFHLLRNGGNAQAWKPILGSPTGLQREVLVGVWPSPTALAPLGGPETKVTLMLMSPIGLIGAFVVIALVFFAVWAAASKSTLLKDSLLPQLEPKKQPYSLGRWQMALWFTLIFAAFVFLFIILGDYETLTTQSLVLMGLSAATAGFAIVVDASKDTPIGAANETLRAIGLRTYLDVTTLRQEIETRQATLAAAAAAAPAAPAAPVAPATLQLQTEIADRQNKLRLYDRTVGPFKSQGWYRDLTTDINGPALHRLQMFVWTLAIGGLFLIEVYKNLTMPPFSGTLLALMGVTSAGYIGFKYTEQQN